MITKYRIFKGRDTIETVEVLRETRTCVYLPAKISCVYPKGERRELKVTQFTEIFDTWEDAHAVLLAKAECLVASFRLHAELAENRLARVAAMTRDVEPESKS